MIRFFIAHRYGIARTLPKSLIDFKIVTKDFYSAQYSNVQRRFTTIISENLKKNNLKIKNISLTLNDFELMEQIVPCNLRIQL